MCVRRLFDGPLTCDNTTPLPHTHTFHASDCPDRHHEPTESDH